MRMNFRLTFLLALTVVTCPLPAEEPSWYRAEQLILEKKCQAAQKVLERARSAIAVAPIQNNLALCYSEQKDFRNAEAALDRFQEFFPEDPSGILLRAFLLFSTGRYEESLTIITSYIDKEPDDGRGYTLLGVNHFMLGRQRQAEVEIKRATELDPRDTEAFYWLGRLYFTRNDMPAALGAYEKMVALDPNNVKAFNHIGQTKEALSEFGQAKEAYLKAIELERKQAVKSQWPYFNLGILFIKEGKPEEAIGYLRQALDRNPSWPKGKVKLAMALTSVGKFEDALFQLNEVLQADAQNAEAHYQLGKLLKKMDKPEQAEEHLLLFEKLRRNRLIDQIEQVSGKPSDSL